MKKTSVLPFVVGVIAAAMVPFFWWLSGHDFPFTRGIDLAFLVVITPLVGACAFCFLKVLE